MALHCFNASGRKGYGFDMNVEEAAKLRVQLEQDILTLLRKFQAATGLTPDGVNVGTHPSYELCNGRRKLLLTSVSVEVKL